MKSLIKKFLKDESGATLVEYAIIVALIAVAAIIVIGTLSTQINSTFSRIASALENA
jgi:pilus assembly protein Flp/PilA